MHTSIIKHFFPIYEKTHCKIILIKNPNLLLKVSWSRNKIIEPQIFPKNQIRLFVFWENFQLYNFVSRSTDLYKYLDLYYVQKHSQCSLLVFPVLLEYLGTVDIKEVKKILNALFLLSITGKQEKLTENLDNYSKKMPLFIGISKLTYTSY